MPRDDLVVAKGMRYIQTPQDIWLRPIRTSQQAFRTRELVYPEAVNEREIAIAMQRDRLRFARTTTALELSRQKVEHARAKFYAVKVKNARLSQFRQQLQKERWNRFFGPGTQTPAVQQAQGALTYRLKEVRIRRG